MGAFRLGRSWVLARDEASGDGFSMGFARLTFAYGTATLCD